MPLELMPAFGKLNGNRVGGPLLGRRLPLPNHVASESSARNYVRVAGAVAAERQPKSFL